MPTITVIVGRSVKQCSWYLYNGNGTLNSSGQILSGGNKSWTMASVAPYVVLSAQPADGYKTPIYYSRTDGYIQNLDEDNTITFGHDKAGTLTATAKPTQTYTLSFNPGATDATGSMTAKTGATSYIVPRCGFARDGYTFKDWVYTDDDGFPQTKNVGDTITLTRNLTLYAQWEQVRPITVTLRSKGTTYRDYNINSGERITLPAPSNTDTERFEYWYDPSSGEIVKYYAWNSYKFYNDTTLYAAWAAKQKITLTLRDRGTTYDTITLYDDEGGFLPTPEDEHNTFEYWYAIGDDGELITYEGGQSVSYYDFDGDTTLYAAWSGSGPTPSDKITITLFDHDLGEEFDLYEGECMPLPIPEDSETEEFEYWYATIDGEIVVFEDQICYEDFTGDTTLYAAWKTIGWPITYDFNGGQNGPENGTKKKDVAYTIPSTRPTRTGYSFAGWSDNIGTGKTWKPGESYTRNSGVTFTAIWTPNTYTVTYNLNGGEGGPDSPDEKTHGVAYTIPSTIPTKEGNIFLHWVDDLDNPYDPGASYVRNANTIFSAVWKLREYDVKYYANGGSGAPADQKKVYGVALTLSTVKPTKEGSVFLGWAKSSAATTAQYQPGDTYTDNKTLSLWAVWTAKTKFYWHGSNTEDAKYFKVGERIDLAVTASAWNDLCDYINTVRSLAGLSTVAFAKVTAGQAIKANTFNIVRNAINQIVTAGYGSSAYVPDTVSKGTTITTVMFNGTKGLKNAINKCMDDL